MKTQRLILAFETATSLGSVALLDSLNLLGEVFFSQSQNYEASIIKSVDYLLRQHNKNIKNIDVIAVSAGPGSFTGLRVGLATVRGLAQSLNKKVVPVCTLDSMAFQEMEMSSIDLCPLLDAKRGEVFSAVYRKTYQGIARNTQPFVSSPEELCRRIKRPTCFFGEGWLKYGSLIRENLGAVAVDGPPHSGVRASIVGLIAAKSSMLTRAIDYNEVEPWYIRRPFAKQKS